MSIHNLLFILIINIFIFNNYIYAQRKPDYVKSADYYYRKGLVQFKHEMLNYSHLNMIKALDRDPRLYQAANILAEIHLLKKNKRKAMEYFNLSLKINNNQPEVHYKIGKLYEYFTEDDLAFKHYKQALRIRPEHILANLNISRFYIKMKDKKNAEKHFRASYIKGRIKSKKIFNLAENERNRGNLKKAVFLYQKVIEINPASTDTYIKISNIYRELNNYARAVYYLERLKFIKPDYEKAYLYLGHIYFNKKLPGKRKYYIDKAIKNLETAIKLNPKNIETYYMLLRIYEYIDNAEKAEKLKKRVMAMEDK